MKRVTVGGIFGKSVFSGKAFVAVVAALVAGSVALSAVPAHATWNEAAPKLLLHLKALTTKNHVHDLGQPDRLPAGYHERADRRTHRAVLLRLPAHGHRRLPLLRPGGNDLGLPALQCGIDYDGTVGHGVEIFSWSLCATLEFSSSGSGPATEAGI